MYATHPSIGLFDSGVGGLSVLREVRKLLSRHDLLYIADSAWCPYGLKPIEQIRARTLAISRWLVEQGAKLVVIACNTASLVALDDLRANLSIPIVGMEPGLKPAVATTRSNCIGVLATNNTLSSSRFAGLVKRYANHVKVILQPCPGLVERVEAGDFNGPITRGLLERYIQPLLAQKVDTLVLGCTHYPFLRTQIAEIAGPNIALIDTGIAVAHQIVRIGAQHEVPAGTGRIRLWTTGDPATVAPVMQQLLDEDIPVEPMHVEKEP